MSLRRIAAAATALLLGSFAGACAASAAPANEPRRPFKILADSCPAERESSNGTIWDEKYVRDHADSILRVAFTLTDDGFPAIPDCPSGSGRDQRCSERDDALVEREQLNLQQVKCVHDAIGGFGTEGGVTMWYELPYHFSSGKPVPIALTFNADVDKKQLDVAAAHPYIARIEPVPGEAALLGARAPAPPKECPTKLEPAEPKLKDAVHGSGPQPFVVDLRDRGVLPPSPTTAELQAASMDDSCPGGPPCDAPLQAAWERVILNRREVTCVKRAMDTMLDVKPLSVSYGAAQIYSLSQSIGPLSDLVTTIPSFAIGITWDEAAKLARHPYVERIWTNGSALQTQGPGGNQPDGCPPDYTKPIPVIECTDNRESPDGKWSSADQQRWESSTGPIDVGIQLREVGPICPVRSCPTPPEPCPEKDMFEAWRQAQHEASQKCVKQLIADLGGSIDPGDTIWLINFFSAQLTWDQIQAVAALPEVIGIQSNDTGTPPP